MQGLRFENRVTVEVAASPALFGAWVDEPTSGSCGHEPYLHIRGWAAGLHLPVTHVVVRSARMLARVPVDVRRGDVGDAYHRLAWNQVVGFDFRFSVLGLPHHVDLELQAELGDQDRVTFAHLSLDRTVHHDADPDLINPLMLTSRGRSGSTRMMHLLAEHPAITAVNRYPCEAHVGAYGLLSLRGLLSVYERHFGTGLARPVAPTLLSEQLVDQGNGRLDPSAIAPNVGDEFTSAFESELYEKALQFSRRLTTDFYERVARQQGSAHPTYFAEKFPLARIGNLWHQDLARDVYPRAREVVLVRDIRDMICSAISFGKRRGSAMFARQSAASDEDYVRSLAWSTAAEMARWQQLGEDAVLLRYEDLVLAPAGSLKRVFGYLEIDDSDERVAAIIEAATRHESSLHHHRTSESPEASIGRWRRDLNPEVQELARELFREFLECLDYPLY